MFSTPAPQKAARRKPIFDTIRAILGRGFRQSEVNALDRALDQSKHIHFSARNSVTCVTFGQRKPSISPDGISLIKQFEGCARLRTDGLVEAYPDPATGAEPWTIGWGATGRDLDGIADIGPGTAWTQQQANDRLSRDLVTYAADVARAIGRAPTTQAQFDAMVSFHYNTGAIARATLTRKHIAGDYDGAGREFQRWNRANGRVMKGLTRRRMAEAKLYSSG